MSTITPQQFIEKWKRSELKERPTWLDFAHRKLDEAVLDAYGWKHDITDDEILARLLVMNLAQAIS